MQTKTIRLRKRRDELEIVFTRETEQAALACFAAHVLDGWTPTHCGPLLANLAVVIRAKQDALPLATYHPSVQ